MTVLSINHILPNLSIKNFRLLQDLPIKHLARVKLIVGPNNVGKSTVLDALRIYAAMGAPIVLEELLNAHDEMLDVVSGKKIRLPVESLFTHRQFPTDGNKEIYIGDLEETQYVRAKRLFNEVSPQKVEAGITYKPRQALGDSLGKITGNSIDVQKNHFKTANS
jgi:predicted ATPase